ncbi:beta strand repeat-containing protein, partial [Chitinophaga sp.]|uniref:beta strand repeat-containing protein n=1 Tax=Chitinophaga sp. TaxID=1869181 RepID=UPI002F94A07B
MSNLFTLAINRNLLILFLILAGFKSFASGTRFKDPSSTATAATGPQITGVTVPLNDYYGIFKNLDFKVKYDQVVIVNQTTGTPYINLTIGTDVVEALYTGGSGTDVLTFRYPIQFGQMDMDGITVQPLLQNNGGTIKDALGNDASTVLQNVPSTALVRVNTSIPSVTLSTVPMPTNAPFFVTATFSEPVSGLSVSDFNVLNTTVSSLSTSDNITYKVLMTPSSEGTRPISLPSGIVQNIGHNPNTPSSTLMYTYDVTRPIVTSVAVPAPRYYKEGEVLTFTVTFNEDITLDLTGGSPILKLGIGSAGADAVYSSVTNNSITFSYTVVNGDMDMDGISVNAFLANGANIRDIATNIADLTLHNIASTANVRVNTSHPAVAVTSTAPAIINAPFNATITFSESVINFVAGDVTVSNGTVTNFTAIDSRTYTITVSPTTDGAVTVNVAANVAENIAANGNNASNTLSLINDVTPPSVTSVDVPPNGFYKASSIMDFTVHFSENITLNTTGGTPQLSLTFGSSTVNATYTGMAGTDALNFSYTVVNGDMDMNGIAVSALLLNGSTIEDIVSNNANPALNNVANTTGIFVNTQHPSVTLSTTAPALVNAPFYITIVFSEAVTGLAGDDFSVTNATVGAPLTADNITYTVLVSPGSNGPVSISLPAGAAVNIGDNDNTASNTLNNTYDGTAPTVTAVAVPANGYYKAGTTLDFIVRFSEDITLNTAGGVPSLGLNIGTAVANATCTGTNGTNGLNFSYTVQSGDMDTDGINVSTLSLNGATIRDDATNNADLTLNNVGNTTFVRVNTAIPTVTLSTTAASYVNMPFVVTVTFSEPVNDLTMGDFTTVSAGLSGLYTTDNITYTLTVTPLAEGPVSISLPADKAVNNGDNGNAASNTLSVTYDITQPTVASVTVPADQYYRAGQVLNFTVNFDEDIQLDAIGGPPYLTLTIGTTTVNATYTGVSTTTGLNFSYTVVNGDNDMDGVTVNSLVLNGSTIKDLTTNNAVPTLTNIGNTANVRVNTVNPTVVLTSAANGLINGPFTVTATFSEPVTVLTESDFSLTNATVSGLTSPDNITFTLTVIPGTNGPVSVQVPTNAVVNVGGNANLASNTLNFTYDGSKPTVNAVAVPTSGYYKAGDILNFKISFSENITLNTSSGNPQLILNFGSSTVNAAYTGTSGTDALNFSYTVVNGDMDMDGIEVSSLLLNGSTIYDAANNNANLTLNNVGNTTAIFVNTQHPTVILSTAAPATVNAPYTATVTFSEIVTGFAATDITATNATVSNLQTSDNITYTVLVTPASNGPVSISVPADKAINVGRNGNAASNTLTNTYDGISPQVISVAVPSNGYYNAGSPLNFKVNFNEDILVNTTGGIPTLSITIGSATVNAAYTGADGTNAMNFSYTVQNGDMDMDGINVGTLVLNGAAIKDVAGNNAVLVLNNIGNTSGVLVNTVRPAVTISTTAASNINTPFTVDIAFSENVTGFTSGDITVTNGTASPLTVIDNAHYSITAIPDADGIVTVTVPANAAQNIGHNDNTASNTLSINYDITKPTVASVTAPADKYYRAGQALNFTINFAEDIVLNTAGGSPYLTLTIGTATVNATYTGVSTARALNFSYTVVNGDNDMDGITVNTLTLNGTTIQDLATNDAVPTLNNIGNTTNVRVNTVNPTVVLTSAANALINGPFTVTATFSEPVTVLTESDFSLTNATASGLTSPDNITFTLTVTPGTNGPVSVQIPTNAVVNVGGNANLASNTLNFTYDGTKPAVNAVVVPVNGHYKAGDILNFAVFFSENISLNTAGGAPYLNIILSSGIVKAAYTAATASSLSFSYTVQPGDMDPDGIALGAALSLNGSTIKDDANNDADLTLNNAGNTTGVFINTQHPAVTLSTAAPAIVNAPYAVTVTFSEPVTGFDISDITAVNATLSNLQTADNITYTILVTPASNGNVSISVPADAAINTGSNGNTASSTLTNTYDGIAPKVTSVAVPGNGYYNAGTILNFTINFDEDILVNTTGGTPTLGITIGSATVNAAYTGTNGANAMNFSYTVQNGDMDMDGINVGALVLNGAAIKDVAGNNAVLTLNSIGNTSGVLVNTVRPTVTITTPAAPSINTPFTVDIAFSENVTGFTSGDITVTNGTASPLTVIDNAHFSITVVPGANGIVTVTIPANVARNIGHNDNTASNTLSINYDITKPTVASVTVPADKYYTTGQVMNFTVNFTEDIILNTAGGNPYLTLTIGTTTVNANYTGVSTARALNFSYTVVNGDNDMDGITVNSLALNGSTIKDLATNDAVPTLNNIGN